MPTRIIFPVAWRNALLSLGRNRYLEIIAPDPQQPASADARDLKSLEKPVLVGWAAHPGDIESGCGATLAAHRSAGDSVVMLVLTGDGDAEAAAKALDCLLVLGRFATLSAR